MKSVPLADRAEFWKFQSAGTAFSMVREVCDYLLQHNLPKSDPIHDPLVTAIYVLYGRPFKQRQPLRLSADIVKKEHSPTHSFLIKFRDQMFAHTDLPGPKTVDGHPLNFLTGETRNGRTTFGISVVTPPLPSVRDLCIDLEGKLTERAHAIWRKHISKDRVSDGMSIVNLSKEDGPFLVPHPFVTE